MRLTRKSAIADRTSDDIPEIDTDDLWLEGTFRSPLRLAAWALALLAIACLIDSLLPLLLQRHATLIALALQGERSSQLFAEDHTLIAQIQLARLSVPLAVVPLDVLFLMWVHRVVKNLLPLNVRGQNYSPGRAVALFMIPFASIVYPIPVMQEVWRGSNPQGSLTDSYSWKRKRGNPLIGIWWFITVFAALVNWLGAMNTQAALEEVTKHHDMTRLLDLQHESAFPFALLFASRALTFVVVGWITARQVARHQRLTGNSTREPLTSFLLPGIVTLVLGVGLYFMLAIR